MFNDYSKNFLFTNISKRFRRHRHVFLQNVITFKNYGAYFHMKIATTNKIDLSSLKKCTTTIHILYGSHVDSIDEYVQIEENPAVKW